MNNVYKDIDEYHVDKEGKILIVFDDEQVCLSGLRFERYFSHHRAT